MGIGELVLKMPFYEWKIDIDSFNGLSVGNELLSPIFYTHYNSKEFKGKWCISIFPEGRDEKDKGCIAFALYNLNPNMLTATYVFSFINNDNVRVGDKKGFTLDIFEKEIGCIYSTSIQKNFFLNLENNMLRDNKLTILCNILIRVVYPVEIALSESEDEEPPKKRHKEFDGFGKVFENKKFSDVTIKADGKSFYLHKCILSSCSEVFDAMFTNDFKDKNEYEIKDIRSEVLDVLFKFIYTGEVEYNMGMIDEILIAAEKYSVKELKDDCERVLQNWVKYPSSLCSVLDYLNLATSNNAENLKKSVIQIISDNLEEFIENKTFDTFCIQHPEIFLEVLKKKFCV